MLHHEFFREFINELHPILLPMIYPQISGIVLEVSATEGMLQMLLHLKFIQLMNILGNPDKDLQDFFSGILQKVFAKIHFQRKY